jgi:GT2 family glycosyltransferase
MPDDMLILADTAAKARLYAIGPAAVLATWDADEIPQHLTATLDDLPVPRPYSRLLVPTLRGRQRALAVVMWPDACFSAGLLAFHNEDHRLIAYSSAQQGIEPFDAIALLAGLDPGARIRVIMLLIEAAQNAPLLRDDPAMAAACREAAAQLAPQPRPITPVVDLAPELVLCETVVDANFGTATAVMLVGNGWVRRLSRRPQRVVVAGRELIYLALERRQLESGVLVLMIGTSGMTCRRLVSARGTPRPSLIEWLEHNVVPVALRDYAARAIADRASAAAAILAELQLLAPLTARALTVPGRPLAAEVQLAIAFPLPGLFAAGWVADPHRLVAGVRAIDVTGETKMLRTPPLRFPYAPKTADALPQDITGFVLFEEWRAPPLPRLQFRFELLLRSGARVELIAPPQPADLAEARRRLLASVPSRYATPDLIERAIAPAIAPLQAALIEARQPADIIQIGTPVRAPWVSVIIPLYRNLDFLRFQLGAFAIDPFFQETQLVYVLDSPEQRGEVEHLLRGLHLLYGLPITLVVNAANSGYAAANNAGAEVAIGRHLLLLNSDVIPERPGWLEAMTAALESDPTIAAVGPKLLFEDGSLQHAGLCFGQRPTGGWFNQHYYKGYPRLWPAAQQRREVPGVTGACCLVRADQFRDVGGFTEDYVIGDYEDSDLCLKLRQTGGRILYEPRAELYHLERQSIRQHDGYTTSLASEYNAWLHEQRWSDAMAELTSEFGSAM